MTDQWTWKEAIQMTTNKMYIIKTCMKLTLSPLNLPRVIGSQIFNMTT